MGCSWMMSRKRDQWSLFILLYLSLATSGILFSATACELQVENKSSDIIAGFNEGKRQRSHCHTSAVSSSQFVAAESEWAKRNIEGAPMMCSGRESFVKLGLGRRHCCCMLTVCNFSHGRMMEPCYLVFEIMVSVPRSQSEWNR